VLLGLCLFLFLGLRPLCGRRRRMKAVAGCRRLLLLLLLLGRLRHGGQAGGAGCNSTGK
jgi:hypothetical protein